MGGYAGGVMSGPRVKVYILDTSALLRMKSLLSTADGQAEQFEWLEELVALGRLAFPLAVKDELSRVRYLDPQAVWAARMIERIPYSTTFSRWYLRRVRKRLPRLVDETKPYDDADLDVLAMALRLTECAFSVCVVTEDRRDRRSQSIVSACREVGVESCSWLEFTTDPETQT